MENKHKKKLELGNSLRNLVSQPYYARKPSKKKILDEILDAMGKVGGTCWGPVCIDGGYSLIFNQCPGACGQVWRLNILDKDILSWLINEINQRRSKQKQ